MVYSRKEKKTKIFSLIISYDFVVIFIFCENCMVYEVCLKLYVNHRKEKLDHKDCKLFRKRTLLFHFQFSSLNIEKL